VIVVAVTCLGIRPVAGYRHDAICTTKYNRDKTSILAWAETSGGAPKCNDGLSFWNNLEATVNSKASTTALNAKADTPTMNVELAKKANTTALNAKADTSTMNAELAKKASTTALNAKADTSTMNAELAKKATTIDLNTKADATKLEVAEAKIIILEPNLAFPRHDSLHWIPPSHNFEQTCRKK
jgi:hypothetical protein